MSQEQEVSLFQKDNGFGDVFQKTKKDASRELKNRENVGLSSFSENEGIVKCVSENQTATGPPVTPIVYNAAKPNFPIVDVAVDEMNEWKNGIELHVVRDAMNGRVFNNLTHWNMRCKFLEVGLRINRVEKIRENPGRIYEKPEGKLSSYIPIRRNKNEKKRNGEVKSNGSRAADHVKKCSLRASSKPKVCRLKVQNVISSGNAKNDFIHQNKMKKDCTKEAKTNGFKLYDCVTNGFQGDSTMKDQSVESNFSPKKKDAEDAKTNGFKSYDCVTNESQGDSTTKNQTIKSNSCPKEKDIISPDKTINNIENQNVEMKCEILQEEQHSKSETCLCKVDDELVLEDVGDKELVLPEVVFDSSQRLTHSAENAGDDDVSCALSVQQHEVFSQNESHPDRSEAKVRVSLSKLERSRRRIADFFGRFRRNRVTPVDI